MFGAEHASTADSYHNLGVTHHLLGDFKAALDSEKHALEIPLKLFGEVHASAGNSYESLLWTQLCLGDLEGALESTKHTRHVQIEVGEKQSVPD